MSLAVLKRNQSEDCCVSVSVSFSCEKLVAEAGSSFENPEEGECLLLEATTKQRLMKSVTG
jgi:hypothetical protein